MAMEAVNPGFRRDYCIKISVLPWVKLTLQDMQVIESTDRALHEQDKSAIRSSCQLFSDVMSKDYPAEVFLQRPGIVHALLGLLTLPEDTDDESIIVYVVQSLDALMKALDHRISFYLHPEFYCTKEESNFLSRSMGSASSLSSASLTSHTCDPARDDGMDPLQCTMQDGRMSDATVYEQLTVPHFCGAVLRRLLPLLRTSPTAVVSVTKALLSTLTVLEKAVTSEVMLEASPDLIILQQDLQSCLEELKFCLDFYRKDLGNGQCSYESRLLYVAISVFTGKFLSIVVDLDSAQQVLPMLLAKTLQEIVLDESIRVVYPAVHSSLLQYACARDPSFANVYKSKECIAQAMNSACKFLKMCQLKVDVSQLSSIYELFDDALPCQPYLPTLDIVREFVVLYSEMFACSDKATNSSGQRALLKLLKHADLAVRREAFRCCVMVVKDVSPLDNVPPISDTTFQRVKFLLQKDIIVHIVACGLTEQSSDIRESCTGLLTSLLHSRWLLTSDHWKEVLLCFAPVLPLLQCYAGEDVAIGNHMLALCNPDTMDGIALLSPLECLMSNLRNMFSHDERVRGKALRYLLRLLTQQSDVRANLPLFEREDKIKGLVNVFCHDALGSLLLQATHFPAVFQVDSLKSLLTVANDGAIDMEVRTSSLHQISVLLEDQNAQPYFEELGGDDLVKKILEDFAKHVDETMASEHMVLCALRILKTRLILSAGFRLAVSQDESYCFILLQCFFLLRNPADTVFPVIFATLAFSSFLAKEIGSRYEICLPSIFTKRLHLPFVSLARGPAHEDSSLELSEFTASDHGPLCKGFLLSWALLWYDGKLKVMKALLEGGELRNIPCYSIIEEQVCFLKATCPHLASADLLLAITNATGHIEAQHAICRLLILVLAVSSSQVLNEWELDVWKRAFDRFLKLSPSSPEDAELLSNIFSLLETVLHAASDPPQEMLQWLWHYILLTHGPCQQLLPKLQHLIHCEEPHKKFSMLTKSLLSFLEVLVVRSQKGFSTFLGSLTLSLVVPLNAAGSPQFYSSVLLEKLLSCLCHALNGLRCGRDTACSMIWDISLKILPSLLEVITAFHYGPGNASGLCMGLRVTQLAAICLHQLADIMSASGPNQWELYWVQQNHRIEGLRNLGLSWLLPLWTDPDPQVRAASLGTAVSLTAALHGQKLLTAHLEQLVGGVWGAALSFLLDHEEASSVREQAALLLCNSTSKLSGDVESWQGPHVRDVDSGVPLYGLSALLALLRHCGFYQEVAKILYCYCPDSQLNHKAITGLVAEHRQQLGVTDLHSSLCMGLAEPVPAVCTSSLLQAVCVLLQNLVMLHPQQATAQIHEHQIILLLLRCIAEEDPSLSDKEAPLLPLAAVRLLTQCARQSMDIRKEILVHSRVFDIIFSYIGKESMDSAGNLCDEIWKFSSVILEYEGIEAYEIVVMCLARHWKRLGEWLTDLLKNDYMRVRQDALFGVVCQLCFLDCKADSMFGDQLSFSKLLDMPVVSSELDTEHGRFDKDAISTLGELIVLLLTHRVKGFLGILSLEKDSKVDLALTTLSSVLSISEAAKNALYNAGFFELLITNISHLSSAARECHHMESGDQASKNSNAVTQALVLRFELLQNAVMQSSCLKELCCSLGVPLTILQLWCFISAKTSLLSSCLKFLLNLTADCLPACQSLTKGCVVSGGTTLSHHLVLLAVQEMRRMPKVKDAVVLRLIYGILGNLSLSENLQKFLSKVNFLGQIVSLSSECEAKGWQLQMQQTLWLKMLITLTSSVEGQKLVGTTKGILALLCEWASPSEKNSQDVQWNSMLVIRNLCFLTANKAKLLATENFLKVLEFQLEEPTSKQCLLVVSTLWALLSNYQKAKAAIHKKKLLCAKIYAAYQLAQDPHRGLCHEVAGVLQTVIGILERKD